MYQIPATVENLVRVISEEAAIALMKAMPKLRFKVARHKSQFLIDIIGKEKTALFLKEYKGEHFYVPDAWNILRANRDEKIRDEYGHKTVAELAREHNLSYRWIQKIQEPCKKKIRKDQGVLF